MVFSSLLFLFIYLPVVLGIYYVTPLKYRNIMLLVANLIFYGWGEPIYILIMVASIFIDYTHGMLVEKYRSRDKLAKLFVCSSVFFNLFILIFFKYYDFIVENLVLAIPSLGGILHPLGLTLPIGISFYTFQTMSYTIDVYRNDAPVQRNLAAFGTYVTLFPQLIAGPIVRYKDVSEQLTERTHSSQKFASGVELLVVGLCKKVLLANNIGSLWDVYKQTSELTVLGAWLGIIAFSFQLYFDFSGYSDMARGLGRMLGFEFLENFNYPYISKSATEFWRRWHISLGTWFKEYVYIPLGGNRVNAARGIFNIFVVWVLTGIWHGAQWNFAIWGLYFAVILIVEKAFLLNILKKLPKVVGHLYLLFIVLVSMAIFAVDTSAFAFVGYLKAMFGAAPLYNSDFLYYAVSYGPILLACAIASTPMAKNTYINLKNKAKEPVTVVLLLAGVLLCTAYLVDASYNPFLYFRF